jgi:hypothetical protein
MQPALLCHMLAPPLCTLSRPLLVPVQTICNSLYQFDADGRSSPVVLETRVPRLDQSPARLSIVDIKPSDIRGNIWEDDAFDSSMTRFCLLLMFQVGQKTR